MKKTNINLLGIGLEKIVSSNKFDLDFSREAISANVTRLINQLWKLIPMRENQEDWEKQLDTVTNEIVGLSKIFLQNPQFLQLLIKLTILEDEELDFKIYRKTVFEAINLLQGFLKNYEE